MQLACLQNPASTSSSCSFRRSARDIPNVRKAKFIVRYVCRHRTSQSSEAACCSNNAHYSIIKTIIALNCDGSFVQLKHNIADGIFRFGSHDHASTRQSTCGSSRRYAYFFVFKQPSISCWKEITLWDGSNLFVQKEQMQHLPARRFGSFASGL